MFCCLSLWSFSISFLRVMLSASLVWLLVLLPVVSIWLNWKMTPYLTVRISALQPKVIAGEESRFMCKLSNAFPWVSLQCELQGTLGNTLYHTEDPIRLCLPVRLRGEEAMELPFRCKYSGNLQLCIHTLAIKVCSVLYRCSRKFLRRRRSR